MEDKETIYDVLNHFKNTKNRLTQGGDSDFITLDYKQLLALIELSKREQQELNKANKKLDKLDNEIKSVIKIVRQQPSESVEDDAWILGRLDGFLSIIKGDD